MCSQTETKKKRPFSQAQLNNIPPLNFHRPFLGPHFLFICLFILKGVPRSSCIDIFFSLSYVVPFTMWLQLCMRFLSLNVWYLTVQKALSQCLYGTRLGVWEHAAADRAAHQVFKDGHVLVCGSGSETVSFSHGISSVYCPYLTHASVLIFRIKRNKCLKGLFKAWCKGIIQANYQCFQSQLCLLCVQASV